MASGKEIRTQIKSVESTQKITRAMEMVAASKMRRAQERMVSARPYAAKIRKVIGHLAHAHPEHRHPYMERRDVQRVGFIVISSDRGLCGGLNANLFKQTILAAKDLVAENVEIEYCTIGTKGTGFFKRIGANIVSVNSGLGDAPKIEDIIGTVRVMLNAFDENRLDKLFLVSNRFVNTMTQDPVVEQLLPIEVHEQDESLQHHWDYIYEPEAEEVLEQLLMRYIEALVYQGIVENIACEQSARMVAMKAASENAGDLIGELKLAYNKARQAAITQELSEIVSGASAV